MEEEIKKLEQACRQKIEAASDKQALTDTKVMFLGKSGELTALLRNLKDVPSDRRPEVGRLANEARARLEALFDDRFKKIYDDELVLKLKNEKIDITIDCNKKEIGELHPLNRIRDKIIQFFTDLGFMLADSPEVETEYYNFEALNIPSDHPARDSQDTFFITDKYLLRSQTSTGQIRIMEKVNPPIKMISSGRVYRADDVDATHSPMFHQLEGLVIDKGITMCDLKGILDVFAQKFFGENTKTRFRPSYFPFTEPSVEVDATCSRCGGEGCSMCKSTGWIEILGAGMVNRNVLNNCKVDPDEYTGFAFGMGLDRITNIIYGITDMRACFENDIRFLKQFK